MSDQPVTVWGMLSLLWLETEQLTIGRPCSAHDCDDVARWLVPWPGREPLAQCQRHRDHTIEVARVFDMEQTIELGTRPLEVARINVPDEDPSVARFAAMELE